MRYLGLDLGSRTLGISMSDKSGIIANTYKTIRHNEEYDRLINEIVEIVKSESIDEIVLGYPKNMDNSLGEKARLSEEFKEKLEKELSIPINLQDERLTTKQAHDTLILASTRREKRKKVVDEVAATIILQSYLDKRRK